MKIELTPHLRPAEAPGRNPYAGGCPVAARCERRKRPVATPGDATLPPSAEPRRWFGHDPKCSEGSESRYFAELDAKGGLCRTSWMPLAGMPWPWSSPR